MLGQQARGPRARAHLKRRQPPQCWWTAGLAYAEPRARAPQLARRPANITMGDAPAADATNDANAEDNKNKLKKKKNEPEKKEKLVIHGRKDEDILGSAYVKKYRRDDPHTDWSRYADNPRGMLNRRRLTREERRRQFTVQNVVGDPRETAPRNLMPCSRNPTTA